MAVTGTDLVVRRAHPEETDAIVDLAGAALGWDDDPRNRDLFEWKHRANPFGASPTWVAESGGTLVGFRTFLRWRWEGPGGRTVPAVRAVDTATHPDHQGRGIFTRLTLGALDELADDGVEIVFNTPNHQSRPGYLRMGWRNLGRVPVAVRPRAGSLPRLAAARRPADKWSEPTDVGLPAPEALADHRAVARLLAARPLPDRLTTARTATYLTWRYGFGPMHYRALLIGDRIDEGVVLFRLRRRGPALEATVCETIGLDGRPRLIGRAVAELLDATGADYAIGTRRTLPHGAALPLPRQGPVLTWRDVQPAPPAALDDFHLTLGDIELF
jgi:GNAT superfamily N-acetyltransferase